MANPLIRKLRGATGTALTWGIAFAGLGTLISSVGIGLGLIPPDALTMANVPEIAARALVAGSITGFVFAMVVAGVERRRTLASLSTARVGAWGFVAAGTLSTLATLLAAPAIPIAVALTSGLVAGAIGGSLAVGTVRIAKRAQLTAPYDDSLDAIGESSEYRRIK